SGRRSKPAIQRGALATSLRTGATIAAPVAALVLGVFAAVYLVLSAARIYQSDQLRSLATNFLVRNRIPVEFDVGERPGLGALLQIRSALPTSVGTVRQPNEAATRRVEMAVLAVQIDGALCAGRLLKIGAIGDSSLNDTAYRTWEEFSLGLKSEN